MDANRMRSLVQVTQLGHVKDLARAFVMCLGNKAAANQIYNISGARHTPLSDLVACQLVH